MLVHRPRLRGATRRGAPLAPTDLPATLRHPQEQTPEHPGGGKPYPVDGECIEQCDCGPVNPCGEYIFDHRGGVVGGRTFTDWFVNEYMVTNETLFHKNPVTGEPQPIGLGWLDDSMTPNGPTEEDPNYIADTGASPSDMASQVAAYRASMNALIARVIPLGQFFWQLMDGGGAKLNTGLNQTVDAATCLTYLRTVCTPQPPNWKRFQLYNIPDGGFGASLQSFTDYASEFLLTRGPYALQVCAAGARSAAGAHGAATRRGGGSATFLNPPPLPP